MEGFDQKHLIELVCKIKCLNKDNYILCIPEGSWNNYLPWQKEYLRRIANNYNAEIKILKDEARGLRSKMMIYEDCKGKEIDID